MTPRERAAELLAALGIKVFGATGAHLNSMALNTAERAIPAHVAADDAGPVPASMVRT